MSITGRILLGVGIVAGMIVIAPLPFSRVAPTN